MTLQVRDDTTDFSADQVALLNIFSEDGAVDQDPMYGYADMNSQANGFYSLEDYSFADTYPLTELSDEYQNLEADSAALLESLAELEQISNQEAQQTACLNLVIQDNYGSLLEADIGAGDSLTYSSTQDQAQISPRPVKPHAPGDLFKRSFNPDEFFKRTFIPDVQPKSQLQHGVGIGEQHLNGGGINSNKRQKVTHRSLGTNELALERDLWGSEEDEDDNEDDHPVTVSSPISTSEARLAGVHSATALFRQPSKAARKYSRPAMSNLFASLELEAEPFLYLQAAAKSYMLDKTHPERFECVGSKGRSESDKVKLKLYATVRAFLHEEGWGHRCFGEDIPGAANRTLVWPEHENKIIARVAPLMRRMVTNERQRQYALEMRIEKRQGGAEAKGSSTQRASATSTESTPAPTPKSNKEDSPVLSDLTLDQHQLKPQPSIPIEHINSKTGSSLSAQNQLASNDGTKYHVNLLQNGHRIQPPIILTRSICGSFSSLVRHIHSFLADSGHEFKSVQILGSNGLASVKDEDSWQEAIADVLKHEWMDGDVKCIIEVERSV